MKRKILFSAAAIAVVGLAAGAIAHTGATGVVKERMAAMESIGASMKSLNAMMRGRESYDAERVRALALSIEGHGGDALTKLFPDNSLQHPTEARPEIWSDWNRFSALAEQLSAYSSALAKAADNPRGGAGGPGMMGGRPGGPGTMQGGPGGPGMMGDRPGGPGMMQGGPGGPGMMQGGTGTGPTPEMLAQMPPDAAFRHLSRTCVACHDDFRKKN